MPFIELRAWLSIPLDGALLVHVLNLASLKSQFLKHLLSMFSQCRRMAANFGWSSLELDRMDRLPVGSRNRMLSLPDNTRTPNLWIVAKILWRVDWRADSIQFS